MTQQICTVFKTILGCESVAKGEMFDEKKTEFENFRETVPLASTFNFNIQLYI